MKQQITKEQLLQLSFNEATKLSHWCFLNGYTDRKIEIGRVELYQPFLTIGQMIQFMDDNGDYSYTKILTGDVKSTNRQWALRAVREKAYHFPHKQLADTLWFAVRQVLLEKKI